MNTTSSTAFEARLDDAFDLDRALASITHLVERCEREPGRRGEMLEVFDTFVYGFDQLIRQLEPDRAARTGAHVKAYLLPLMRRAENGYRWYAKPCGYAGDYLTIARMYDDEARGDGEVGALLDRCFLRLPAAVAVQNRRALLTHELCATVRACHDRPARVTSLVHRSEDDMHALFRASVFGAGCTRITYEPQGINLFAECVKA